MQKNHHLIQAEFPRIHHPAVQNENYNVVEQIGSDFALLFSWIDLDNFRLFPLRQMQKTK
jgi:hypothetical protein